MKTYLSSCSAFLLLSFISICNAGSYCSTTIGQPKATPEDIAHYEQVYEELLTNIPPSLQSAACPDDHKIIIEGAANIQNRLKEIEAEASMRRPRLITINKEFKLHYDLSEDSSLSQEERSLASAKALKTRAKLNIIVRQLAESNLERYGKIDNELEGMIQAARNLDASNEAVRAQTAEINAQTRISLANQDKLVRVIQDVRDGTVTEASKHRLKASHNLHAKAVQTKFQNPDLTQAEKALKETLAIRDYAPALQKIRNKVIRRQQVLMQLKRIADRNIRIIADHYLLFLHSSRFDEVSSDFSTLEDPLGLNTLETQDPDTTLRPGRYAKLITTNRNDAPSLIKGSEKTLGAPSDSAAKDKPMSSLESKKASANETQWKANQ